MSDTSLRAEVIPAQFETVAERAAILEIDARLQRDEADDAAAREFGYADAAAYRRQLLRYWRSGLVGLRADRQGSKGNDLVQNALAFLKAGWADKALDLGWSEAELYWADPSSPWDRLDQLGAAYFAGDDVRLITAHSVEIATRTGATMRLQRTRGDGRGCVPWARKLYEETTGG